jgi:hypothetical protein
MTWIKASSVAKSAHCTRDFLNRSHPLTPPAEFEQAPGLAMIIHDRKFSHACQNTETPICNELHNPLSISNDAQIVDPQRGTQNLAAARSVGSSPTTGTIWKMQLTLSPRGEIKSNLHHLVYLGKRGSTLVASWSVNDKLELEPRSFCRHLLSCWAHLACSNRGLSSNGSYRKDKFQPLACPLHDFHGLLCRADDDR